jgi:uncharacterized protein YjbI with pentapeptide repeats
VTFTNAKLVGADFNNVQDANNADFSGADLSGTNFLEANVFGATFTGATWVGAVCPDGTNANDHANTCVGHLSRAN